MNQSTRSINQSINESINQRQSNQQSTNDHDQESTPNQPIKSRTINNDNE